MSPIRDNSAQPPSSAARRAVMALCAEATAGELWHAVSSFDLQDVRELRPTQSGLVMLRGRMGGDGSAFNLGEASVTRACVALPGRAEHGFAYHLGRDRPKARNAAILDALWQDEERREAVETAIEPIRIRLTADRALKAERTAATRVDFFTLVRGED